MRVKFLVPFVCNLLTGPVVAFHLDEVDEEDDQVHAFQIDDAKIDVSSYVAVDCNVKYISTDPLRLPDFRM